jgi:hypothetical protein
MSEQRSNQQPDPLLEQLRRTYHVPGETPTKELWTRIEARIGDAGPQGTAGGTSTDDGGVIDLSEARARRASSERRGFRATDRAVGWAVAAAAVLILGIGIGRMTAPVPSTPVAARDGAAFEASEGAVALAALQHLGRTESLLTMVRADARSGRVDPATAEWAAGLLAETRILLDVQEGANPAVGELLLDLELVLIQIVGVAETGSMDEARARTELELALRTLEDGEVLPRIQAVLPETLEGV